ncbi:SMI1/KNR4 family protein [Persicimonas caeni]|uniref:SMI1/KNR4 family protein n=1 Tax=Persicimonas caeni TaxID=2292766 RepID=A0A4Y6PVI8_PERCE|nr:SMI1/KNR4 family protein [Persicimonas caeni]QDG52139.1 SMI1/KNR4 family protein [Persicimonas caeni]QED33361.1 SMI1/KNR4 family protein [Persicimonas caeni]
MTHEDFEQLVEELKAADPVAFGLESDPKATVEQVEKAEQDLGVTFPRAYRFFLRNYGGGQFAYSRICSVEPNSPWNIVELNQSTTLLPENFVAFTENGTGDFYGFQCSSAGSCSEEVYFYDHEAAQQQATDKKFLEFLAWYALS